MPLHVIIAGPPGSGKTTLFHKLIRDNPIGTFAYMIDGPIEFGNVVILPNNSNWIITTQALENVPAFNRHGALTLNVQRIRGNDI